MTALKIISYADKSFSDEIKPNKKWTLSPVEQYFLEKSERLASYPNEKICTIESDNPLELGRLTALRFLEFILKKPKSVIALPTGKTPEYFIKFLDYYKKNWTDPKIQKELIQYGINSPEFPKTSGLKFVQIDEFFPVNPQQENSFLYYLKKYYFPILNLAPENMLTMDLTHIKKIEHINLDKLFPSLTKIDLSLLTRKPKNHIEKKQKKVLLELNKFCIDYEEKIKQWGGIDFFLGGIGPDGHIAFNITGSDVNSKTRLVQLNYASAAASAIDLGGMQAARDKTAITIGLNTITAKKDATIIIMAAGETKANLIEQACQKQPSPESPASILQGNPSARFYVTKGAASKLSDRRIEDVQKTLLKEIPFEMIEAIIIELALNLNKTITDLKAEDFKSTAKGALILSKIKDDLSSVLEKIKKDLIKKIERGIALPEGQRILHTSPHHDDIILSYHPAMRDFILKNNNSIIYLTSGFNLVSNLLVNSFLKKSTKIFLKQNQNYIFNKTTEEILEEYKQAYLDEHPSQKDKFELILFLHAVKNIFKIKSYENLNTWIKKFKKNYFHKNSVEKINFSDILQGTGLTIDELWQELVQKHYINQKGYISSSFKPYKINFHLKLNPKFQKLEKDITDILKVSQERYYGEKDSPEVQQLKGEIRESESNRKWSIQNIPYNHIHHLRLPFYNGTFFNPIPTIEKDATRVLNLIKKVNPQIVTVAFDPEGSGPDTHYKVLQTVAQALRMNQSVSQPHILGYRNVWFRFKPSESNIFIPVNKQHLSELENIFINCFTSQRKAEFPHPDYDMPFSEVAKKIQLDQLQILKKLLGTDYFKNNQNPRIKYAEGFVFLKEMDLKEFLNQAAELEKRVIKS